jgi:SPP1 gp7 family putative phage head morphogenesis protein
MPKALFANPDSVEREYTRALLRYARDVNRASGAIILPKVGDIVGAYRREARLDSWGDDLARLIAEFIRVVGVMGAATIQTLPSRFEVVSNFNHAQFRMVVKANTGVDLPPKNPQGKRPSLLGVNVFQDEAYLQPIAEGWVAENTALIKDVPEKLAKDLEAIIRRGTMSGASVRDLQKQIRDRWPMMEHRAKLIAQDQTLKLNASLTRHRLESVGVKEYTWRSVMDNRVRPEHAEYNGKVYSWDKPPPDGNPGTPVRCRCRAQAVWPDEGEMPNPAIHPAPVAPVPAKKAKVAPKPKAAKHKPAPIEPPKPSHEAAFEAISNYQRRPEVQAAHDRYDKALADFEKAKQAFYKSGKVHNSPEHKAAFEAQAEGKAAQELYAAMKQSEVSEALKLLEVPIGNRAAPSALIEGKPPQSVAKKAREAADIVSRLVHKDIAPKVKFANTRGRAHYSNATRTANLSGKDPVRTYAHEMVHDIEYQHPEISKASKAYVLKRANGQPLRKLRELTGNKSYSPTEVTYEDEWVKRGGHHYMGKVYDGRAATELLTMGFERVMTDPVGFAKQDPDYLKFMLRILHNAKD